MDAICRKSLNRLGVDLVNAQIAQAMALAQQEFVLEWFDALNIEKWERHEDGSLLIPADETSTLRQLLSVIESLR
jgi:hypothetical protein